MVENKAGLREILTAAVLIAFIGVFYVLNFAIPAPDVLVSERRMPARFPDFDADSVFSGTFMSKFEDYTADRFVFRDFFRGIRSFIVFDVFMQTDKSGIYRSGEVGIGEFKLPDSVALRLSTERIKKAADSLDGYGLNISYSIIPDKSVFAERYMPGFDMGLAESVITDVLRGYNYISLANALDGRSFYRTDLHWDQSRIAGVVTALLSGMGRDAPVNKRAVASAGEFAGVYAGQLALPTAPDTMAYYDIPGLKVSYLNERTLEFEPGPVYDMERFAGVDPYDMFLKGPQALIVIENESAPDRELYLFRDSFGSSLAPLLAESYSKITVIDLRYIHLMLLGQFIEFTPGSDVLFIYSSMILNNPSILQT